MVTKCYKLGHGKQIGVVHITGPGPAAQSGAGHGEQCNPCYRLGLGCARHSHTDLLAGSGAANGQA